MRSVILGVAFLLGQVGQQNTLQEKPVERLPVNSKVIPLVFGGKFVELVNAPTVIRLPRQLHETNLRGNPWQVKVKNLGPRPVAIRDDKSLNIQMIVGQSVEILWDGERYVVKH